VSDFTETGDAMIERAFRRGLTPPERLPIGEWAETHLRLSPKVTNYAGPFRRALVPYLEGLFSAYDDPTIDTIYLCWGAQTAKTTGELICMLSAMDQDPGPTLWAMPTETLARSFSQQRLQPLIDETPRLAEQKPEDLDRYKTLEMEMSRMTLTLVGGNSPANLSSRPIRRLFADEVDKFPLETIREGSALNLAIRRTATFWNRKIMVSSTPSMADGQIWTGLLSGDWRQYWVPCPACGEYQVLVFHQIRIPEKLRDPDEIRRVAWYECVHCRTHIESAKKRAMLEAGQWRPRQEPVPEYDWTPPEPGGRIASFHLPSWYSPLGEYAAWGSVLARFIEAKPYPDKLREVINSDMAEPWEERGETKSEGDVLAHCSEYNEGTLPSDSRPVILIQTVDVQKSGLYYVVRAWGPHEESWLVSYGMVGDFWAIEETLARSYAGPGGAYAVKVCLIDSKFRTGEVYEFCRTHPGCVPYRGEGRSVQPIRWSMLDRMPDGTPIPGGIRLLLVDGQHFKGVLFARMAIKRGDPGYWHLHAGTARDYARQIVAEILVDKTDSKGHRFQEWRQVRPDNHYLDCEIEQLAAANMLGVRFAKQAARPAGDPAKPATPTVQKPKRDPWKPQRFKI
jgi:phage terminase large subunit GpA-like protein